MKNMAKLTLALVAASLLLTACETMEGLGQDTSKLGNNISNSAEKNTPK